MTTNHHLDTPGAQPATHGLGYERVEPDWAPLTAEEAAAVLGGPARLRWHSPRPLSAAAVVEHDGRRVFLKRHHVSVRTLDGLAEEHAFLRHLRSRGAPVVEVLGAEARGEWTYEVHTLGAGSDLYQDALSWTPFASRAHAYEAGAALARLHMAAAGHTAPPRRPQPLVSSFGVFGAADPVAALHAYTAQRPYLAEALELFPVDLNLERLHLPLHAELAPLLPELEPLWTHNDWHASNLLWDTAGGTRAAVATVLDFGLSDRTTAVHDLAVALERNMFGWLELPSGRVPVQLGHLEGLLEGYARVRPLEPAEAAALPALLPLVNAEYALSEMDYFHGVTRSRENTAAARAYFSEHTRWFTSPDGTAALDRVRAVCRSLTASGPR
ncbi:aminoglycoside phosphotransferase family protein [Streptomyces sp. NPDC005423]|uniref:phosphotransferase enzyme family protein n=1 Tax=Streptomyces sp. NPDC005423 TaxID=3155343 RepID=UPI0033B089B1